MKIFGLDITRTNKAATPKVKTTAVGFIGLKTASGRVEEEFLDNLVWPEAGAVYHEMASNDAIIGGCLYLIETLIRQADWKVEAVSQEAGDVEAANFLESCLHDMSSSWDDFICEVLSMLVYGFSFHEVVYKTRRGPFEKKPQYKSKYSDGRIGWQDLAVRSQASLDEWIFDEATGKPIAFFQDPGRVGGEGDEVEIPIEGNLLFKTKSSRGNPEGHSILRRAYRSWYFKKYIEELEGIGIERNLAGIPVLSPPEDVPLFDDQNPDMQRMLGWAQQLVDELRQDRNHGLVIPGGWDINLLGTQGSSSKIDTDKVIRRHEARIAMSMLSDLIMMGSDRTGSFALADVKHGLLIQSLHSIINSIATTINTHAVPILFAVNNWQLEELPKITADSLKPIPLREIALLLRSYGLDITKDQTMFNYFMTLVGAPELSNDEFNAFIVAMDAEKKPATGDETDRLQDTVDNQYKE